ncbi:MAG: hypothetical protein R3C28_32195 [Pirellulaceae bacterium]
MSRLTVTEKEHWKQRIERRIDKAIEATERRHPNLMNDIKTKADAQALEAMGIASQMSEVTTRRKQCEALTKEADAIEQAVHRRVLGEETYQRLGQYSSKHKFDEQKRKQVEAHEEELLGQCDEGREILKLRQEREALLDTVWLATSNVEIRNLWSRVSAAVADDVTPLQEEILSEANASKS